MTNWEPPKGQSQWFGFISPAGPQCIALDSIASIFPEVGQSGPTGLFLCLLKSGQVQLKVPGEAIPRLLRIMGWKEVGGIERA